MTGSDSEAARESADDQASSDQVTQTDADRASEGLRDQIAALRQQVKDAQDTLRDHERRRDGGRSFKR